MDKGLALHEIEKVVDDYDNGVITRVDLTKHLRDILDLIVDDERARGYDLGVNDGRSEASGIEEDEVELDIDLDQIEGIRDDASRRHAAGYDDMGRYDDDDEYFDHEDN